MNYLLQTKSELDDLIQLKLLTAIKRTQLLEAESESNTDAAVLSELEKSGMDISTSQLSTIKNYVLKELYEEIEKTIVPKIVETAAIEEDRYKDYVALSWDGKIEIIKPVDILYCMSESKKTNFYMSNGKVFPSTIGIGEYEKNILDEQHFYRIHNSYLVNLSHVRGITQKEGNHFCELENGVLIPISKRKTSVFKRHLKLKV